MLAGNKLKICVSAGLEINSTLVGKSSRQESTSIYTKLNNDDNDYDKKVRCYIQN